MALLAEMSGKNSPCMIVLEWPEKPMTPRWQRRCMARCVRAAPRQHFCIAWLVASSGILAALSFFCPLRRGGVLACLYREELG
jgi:hypothetical protein